MVCFFTCCCCPAFSENIQSTKPQYHSSSISGKNHGVKINYLLPRLNKDDTGHHRHGHHNSTQKESSEAGEEKEKGVEKTAISEGKLGGGRMKGKEEGKRLSLFNLPMMRRFSINKPKSSRPPWVNDLDNIMALWRLRLDALEGAAEKMKN